jgi:hypothetical protein
VSGVQSCSLPIFFSFIFFIMLNMILIDYEYVYDK